MRTKRVDLSRTSEIDLQHSKPFVVRFLNPMQTSLPADGAGTFLHNGRKLRCARVLLRWRDLHTHTHSSSVRQVVVVTHRHYHPPAAPARSVFSFARSVLAPYLDLDLRWYQRRENTATIALDGRRGTFQSGFFLGVCGAR